MSKGIDTMGSIAPVSVQIGKAVRLQINSCLATMLKWPSGWRAI